MCLHRAFGQAWLTAQARILSRIRVAVTGISLPAGDPG